MGKSNLFKICVCFCGIGPSTTKTTYTFKGQVFKILCKECKLFSIIAYLDGSVFSSLYVEIAIPIFKEFIFFEKII